MKGLNMTRVIFLRAAVLLIPLLIFTIHDIALGDELRVGTTVMTTGPYGNYGRHALQGLQLAIDEVNSRGGVGGRMVKLVVEDFGALDLKQAVSEARKLISIDKVELLFPLIIEDSEPIVPITTKVPLFTMALGCGTRKCAFNVGPYHSRAPSSHDAIVERLISYAQEQKISRPCIVAAEATYFEQYGRYIEELLHAKGLAAVYASVPMSISDDYRDVATRFANNKCDAIFSWVSIGSIGSFFRRVRESGSKALLFGIVETDDPMVLDTAGSAAEGVVFARFDPGSQGFQSRYRERFGEDPSRPAVPAFDGAKVLFSIVDRTGTQPENIRAALIKVKDLPAENGTISFTDEGERLGEAVQLMRIEGNKAVAIR
jgi:branched-chain amino acid transport system substrate-binding protein